jgi:hypothetical protein
MYRRATCLALLSLLLLGASPRLAAADDLYAYDDPVPDPGDDGVGRYYVGGGGAISADGSTDVAGYLDGGLRIPGRHIWVRGKVAGGTASEATLGVEGRRCAVSGVLCGSLGFDAGRVFDEGYLMALRAGGDLALTRSLAVRLSVEARRLAGLEEDETEMEMIEHAPVGVGASLGLVVRF